MRVGRDIFTDLSRRWVSRSPVERGIVSNFVTQEAVFDHVFSTLGVKSETVGHPVVMTEALCCPATSREGVSELLFELYGAPSVAYGVDSLFSRYHNQRATVGNTGQQRTAPPLPLALPLAPALAPALSLCVCHV